MEALHQRRAKSFPGRQQTLVRRMAVNDGQAVPEKPMGKRPLRQGLDLQLLKFPRLDQGEQMLRAPVANGLQIRIQITRPTSRHGLCLMLARCEGNAYGAALRTHRQFGNTQGVGETGSLHGKLVERVDESPRVL